MTSGEVGGALPGVWTLLSGKVFIRWEGIAIWMGTWSVLLWMESAVLHHETREKEKEPERSESR